MRKKTEVERLDTVLKKIEVGLEIFLSCQFVLWLMIILKNLEGIS